MSNPIIALPDNELAARAARGQEGAQHEVYKRYCGRMMTVCRRYARDTMEAQDLHQTGWIRAFDKLGTYREAGSLEGWLRQVFTRSCLTEVRRRNRSLQYLDEVPEAQTPTTYSEFDFMAMEKLLDHVADLPTGARLVFNLFALDGMSHAEIGRELGISEGNSRSQLLRARTLLAARLGRPLVPPAAKTNNDIAR